MRKGRGYPPANNAGMQKCRRMPDQDMMMASAMPQIPVADAEPNDRDPIVSVIIPAMNESARIAAVVAEARKVHPHTEVIVVANGCRDDTEQRARAMGATVLSFAEPLGNDVGRSIGALKAQGRIMLFIDGDMVIPAKELRPFVQAVSSGVDIALNNYTGPVRKATVHPVILAKYTLNSMLGRSDLKGASMTAVPHAISRKATEALGTEMLSVPPKAQAAAVMAGLRVEAVHRVEVGRLNPGRVNGTDPLEMLVLGDHLEALDWIVKKRGPRGGFHDGERQRNRVR